MLIDAMWALYWIDVFTDFPALILIPLIVFIISSLITSIYNAECQRGKEKKFSWVWWRVMPLSVVVGLLVMAVPSKETMYLMLAVKTTDTIVNSDTGQKVQKVINNKVDVYLKQLEGISK